MGRHIQFSITYSYTLNKRSHIRTGEIDPGDLILSLISFHALQCMMMWMDGINIPISAGWNSIMISAISKQRLQFRQTQVVWATGNLIKRKRCIKPGLSINRLQAGGKQ